MRIVETGKLSVLQWFWYVQGMEKEIMVKNMYQKNVKDNSGRIRPQRRG